jgi:hypothetical protein
MFGVLDVLGLFGVRYKSLTQTEFSFKCIYCLEKLIGVLFSICSTRGFNSQSRNPILPSARTQVKHLIHLISVT